MAAKKSATETPAHEKVEVLLPSKNIIIQFAKSSHHRRLVLFWLHFIEHGVAKKLQTMSRGVLDELVKINRPGQRIEIIVIKGGVAIFDGMLKLFFQELPVQVGFFFRTGEKF